MILYVFFASLHDIPKETLKDVEMTVQHLILLLTLASCESCEVVEAGTKRSHGLGEQLN